MIPGSISTHGMVSGCQCCHLVPVSRIVEEEQLDLLRNLGFEESMAADECHETGNKHLKCDWLSPVPTCDGESLIPHSCTSFINMPYGPHFSTFLSLPKTDSSSYVIPMSTWSHKWKRGS